MIYFTFWLLTLLIIVGAVKGNVALVIGAGLFWIFTIIKINSR